MQVVLSIAGSDSGAGAGIQADLKTIAACGAYAATAVTAVTAQTPSAVLDAFELPVALVRAQVAAAFEAFPVAAVKTGMLANAEIVGAVARELRARSLAHVVVDPVMVATSGHALLAPAAVDAVRKELLPCATLVTPNRHEARILTGIDVANPAAAEAAGRTLVDLGCDAVLLKGGHFDEARATDVLVTRHHVEEFTVPVVDSRSTHGTGCTLSAAIATFLALGQPLPESIRRAKWYVAQAMHGAPTWGGEQGPTDHFFFLRRDDAGRWPEVLRTPRASQNQESPP